MNKPRFYREAHQFIDPTNCGSTIQWQVQYSHRRRRYVDIDLRDCDRKIRWSADGDDCARDARAKIKIAIEQLNGCLRAIDEMEQKFPKRKVRAKKKKS